MEFRKRADSVRRQKFLFVEHVAIDALELLAVGDGEQQAGALRRAPAHVHVLGYVRDDA